MDMAQSRMRVDQLLGHRPVVEAIRRVGDHQPDRTTDRREVAELSEPMPGQAHHRDGPGAQQAEQGYGEASAIGQLQQHPVGRADSQGRETAGGLVGEFVQLA